MKRNNRRSGTAKFCLIYDPVINQNVKTQTQSVQEILTCQIELQNQNVYRQSKTKWTFEMKKSLAKIFLLKN